MQQYWPGTNVPKSRGNAFDWKGNRSQIFQSRSFKNAQAAAKAAEGVTEKARSFTIHTRAKAAK